MEGSAVRWTFFGVVAASWIWAMLACKRFWELDPDYAYGWSVPPLVAFFLWRRLSDISPAVWDRMNARSAPRISVPPWLLTLPALAILPLEVYRTEYLQSGFFVWSVNLWAVGLTLAAGWWLGGRILLGTLLFPVLFYLTAVPWPAILATPVKQGLMTQVAQVVAEILLWIGIPVTLQGAQLHMANGVVGIVEACSGIRSLQTAIMVSLAIGELQLLSAGRRAGLLGISVLLALATNLGRTFTLCWIMESHGDKAMHEAHDPVGNVAMYSLLALIYGIGRLLTRPDAEMGSPVSTAPWARRLESLKWGTLPDFRPFLAVGLLMVATAQTWYFVLRLKYKPQVVGIFTPKLAGSASTVKREFDEHVWRVLAADSGVQFDILPSSPDERQISVYHLFWKPSPWVQYALGHRPDICMPGAGWIPRADVRKTQIRFNGHTMDFHLFTFDREDSKTKALQLWGIWRNGRPVEMDYSRILRSSPEVFGLFPTGRHLMGVEVVSAFMTYEGEAPGLELFERALPKHLAVNP
ncbi:MAG: exosortase/archaeosortase family protein [Verrucomicrobiota bacterium]